MLCLAGNVVYFRKRAARPVRVADERGRAPILPARVARYDERSDEAEVEPDGASTSTAADSRPLSPSARGRAQGHGGCAAAVALAKGVGGSALGGSVGDGFGDANGG